LPIRRRPCYHCFPGPESSDLNDFGRDPFYFAHEARALREGKLRERARPPGIPNPRRRVPDLAARPPSAKALLYLIDSNPHLLQPLAA
jgi:hypothetical protein